MNNPGRRGFNNAFSNSFGNNSNSNNGYNDSGSGYSNVPFFLMSQNSSGGGGNGGGNGNDYGDNYDDNQSSNFNYNGNRNNQQQYNFSRGSAQSSGNYSTSGSIGYGGNSQGQSSSFQYSASMSSDMSSAVPFTYADNDTGNNNNRKNKANQPWVKRDSLRRPAPYAGARGMNLMQKMGWNPGQGLGRRENGELEPQFPEIKMDKRGLDAGRRMNVPFNVKAKGGRKLQMSEIKIITEGKNPVSILEEYCSKRKLEAAKYVAVVDEGPVHAKIYKFKVTVDGTDYTAEKSSNVKKTAKVEAAKKCLIDLGVLTNDNE